MNDKIMNLFNDIGEARTMVLSIAIYNKVSSRMMSVVVFDNKFYFQTSNNMRKYKELSVNSNASLCFDNCSVEGVCKDIGIPLENSKFSALYEKYYKMAYENYSALFNERLIEFKPTFVKRWIYENGKPYEETFDFINELYNMSEVNNEI